MLKDRKWGKKEGKERVRKSDREAAIWGTRKTKKCY